MAQHNARQARTCVRCTRTVEEAVGVLDARLVGQAPHVGEEAKRGEMEHVLKLGRQHRVAVDAWVEVHEVVAVADCPAIEKLRALEVHNH